MHVPIGPDLPSRTRLLYFSRFKPFKIAIVPLPNIVSNMEHPWLSRTVASGAIIRSWSKLVQVAIEQQVKRLSRTLTRRNVDFPYLSRV